MSKITKPNFTDVWSSAGSKTTPSSLKIQTGWVGEKPPYEYWNWAMNRNDVGAAYSFQMGVAEWDSTVEYQYSASYKSYIQRNGLVYKALQVGANKDPASEAAYWELAFDDYGVADTVQSNLNTHITNYGTLTSLSNAATARSNLGVYSTSQIDNALALKALLGGSSSQLFSAANGTAGYEVVNKSQLDTGLATKAPVAGNSGQEFAVATATTGNSAVNLTQLLGYVSSGMVLPFAGSAAPTGWLECNGAAVSRTTFSALFAAIGTLWGIGDGSTTFNLPETRGEFIRGYDHSRGVDSGRAIGVWQDESFGIHAHVYGTRSMSGYAGDSGNGGGMTTAATYDEETRNTAPTGGSETRPRNVAMMYIIKI